MKRLIFGLGIGLLPPFAAATALGPHLVVNVTATRLEKNDDGIVKVEFSNDGDAIAYVPKTEMPITVQGRIINNVFKVVDETGMRARYLGQGVAIAPTIDSYVPIAPGETSVFEVDIPRSYEVAPGLTRITFESIQYEKSPLSGREGNFLYTDDSRPLEVWFTSKAISHGSLQSAAPRLITPRSITECPSGFSASGLIASAKALARKLVPDCRPVSMK